MTASPQAIVGGIVGGGGSSGGPGTAEGGSSVLGPLFGLLALTGAASGVFLLVARRRRRPDEVAEVFEIDTEPTAASAEPVMVAAASVEPAILGAAMVGPMMPILDDELAPVDDDAPLKRSRKASPAIVQPAIVQPAIAEPATLEPATLEPAIFAAAMFGPMVPVVGAEPAPVDAAPVKRTRKSPSKRATAAATAATAAATAAAAAATAAATAAAVRTFGKPPKKGVERAKVSYKRVRISSEPDAVRSVELGRLDRGDEIEILDSHEGFLRVRTPDDITGWILRHTIIGAPTG